MHPPTDSASRSKVQLVIESGWLEAAAAAGVRVEQQGWATAFVPKPVSPKLQPDLAVERQVGILRREPQDTSTLARSLGAVGGLVPDSLAVQGEVAE
jgi:hypothetical protein